MSRLAVNPFATSTQMFWPKTFAIDLPEKEVKDIKCGICLKEFKQNSSMKKYIAVVHEGKIVQRQNKMCIFEGSILVCTLMCAVAVYPAQEKRGKLLETPPIDYDVKLMPMCTRQFFWVQAYKLGRRKGLQKRCKPAACWRQGVFGNHGTVVLLTTNTYTLYAYRSTCPTAPIKALASKSLQKIFWGW